jgi:hypothetical protein
MSRKFMFLALVIVLSLGTMGAVYTFWGQTSVIGGYAKTAVFNVNLSDAQAVSVPGNNGVSSCTATPGPDANSITLNVDKAVPGYKCTINFKVNNSSDVPVKFNPLAQTWMAIPSTIAPYASYACPLDVLQAHTSQACSIVFEMPSTVGDGEESEGTVVSHVGSGLNGSLTLSPVARQYTPELD